jgi:hypothetical protein
MSTNRPAWASAMASLKSSGIHESSCCHDEAGDLPPLFGREGFDLLNDLERAHA